MSANDPDGRVLIMAPVGRDAAVMAELLAGRGFKPHICRDTAECRVQMLAGAGALVVTDEALGTDRAFDLLNTLNTQPTWSELPLIILTGGGESRLAELLELAAAAPGSVTLLERPIRMITLLRSIEVALTSRQRQYQVRDLLGEQRRTALQLREMHDKLADRARELEKLVDERTAKLAESNEQLRREMKARGQAQAAREALRRQLIKAQEEERRRVARELHDQMGQNLTALFLGLKSLDDSEPRDGDFSSVLRPLQELAAQTARDLHRVALELRPAALDDLGLVKALRNLLENWSLHCRIESDFEADNYDPAKACFEIETTLYRLVQEALNNVAKHSGARQVSVVLRTTPDHMQAIVEDDGVGFDVRAKQGEVGRLGLKGMQERLALISGNLNIESAPGRGTTLVVRIPIAKDA
jgi:signal transduction histidine kinase